MFRAGMWSLVTTSTFPSSCRSVGVAACPFYSQSSSPISFLATLFQAESPQTQQYCPRRQQYDYSPKVQDTDKLGVAFSFTSPTLFGKLSRKNTGYHHHPNHQEQLQSFNLQKRLYHYHHHQFSLSSTSTTISTSTSCICPRLSNDHCHSHQQQQQLASFSSQRLYSSQSKKDGEGDKSSEKDCKNPESPAAAAPSDPDSSCTPPSQPLVLTIKNGLATREAATDFLGQLSDHQRQLIYHTLNIEILRDKYEGTLGSSCMESHHFLSKYGRPATADPTGTLCEISPKWLSARLDEKAPPAPASAIWAVVVKNALPFIGFGFLDNLIMILAGDYIDLTIGAALGISTMAAAALGNTISDVAGIGSAWYVEAMASKIGIRDPDLTPSQMASGPVRWACNLGRAFGVTIGCLLGMFPLMFLPSAEEKKAKKEEEEQKASAMVDNSKFA